MLDLCCQTVTVEPERSEPGAKLDLLSSGVGSERLLDGLTADQRAAVTHRGGRLIVRGGAGSGKTRVIETRLRWLIEQGCAPERICLLAASEGRAAASSERLETALELGYEELHVLTAPQLAALVVRSAGAGTDAFAAALSPGDRLAMLVQRIDELSLEHHDFGGRPNALLAGFIRRIDRLKAELVGAAEYVRWAQSLPAESPEAALEREFAEIYQAHERMLSEHGARDHGGLIVDAISLARKQPGLARRFEHLLIDDAQELDLAAARLALEVGQPGLTAAGDPDGALRRFRAAGAARLASFEEPGARVVELGSSQACPERVWTAARAALERRRGRRGAVAHGRLGCRSGRSVAVRQRPLTGPGGGGRHRAADRLERTSSPGGSRCSCPRSRVEGQAVAVALEERAIAHRLVGEAAFFQRAEIRDVLAWLRLLADPTDAAAVVRALARPPIELRSVDIARCTQIARRRKLDMVAALAAATESPQVPPEARERIRGFLKLYRSGDGVRRHEPARPLRPPPDRPARPAPPAAIRRSGRRRRAAAARWRVRRAGGGRTSAGLPQATPREFARSIAAVADYGLREQEEPQLSRAQRRPGAGARGRRRARRRPRVRAGSPRRAGGARRQRRSPTRCCASSYPPTTSTRRDAALGQALYVGFSRARRRLVLSYPHSDDRGTARRPLPLLESVRQTLDGTWVEQEEELFGPAEALHSTYRLMRDELLEGDGARRGAAGGAALRHRPRRLTRASCATSSCSSSRR